MARRGGAEGEREEDMNSPAAKRLCTSAVSGLRRIAVEGNIAAGKSTFLRLLKESSPTYHVISEPITKWQNVDSEGEERGGGVTSSQQCGGNLLDMFYKEPKRWAYTFQTYACLSRLKAQLKQVPEEVIGQPSSVVFFERSVHSDRLVFAENCHDSGLLSDVEWSIYCDWHSFLLESLPLHFDAFIYLKTSPQTTWGRMQKRGRPEEQDVPLDYLKALHDNHEKWLLGSENKMTGSRPPVLVLECDSEFEEDKERLQEHLDSVAKFISSLSPRQ